MDDPGKRDNHRVLIVDDDQLTAMALIRALKAEHLIILAVAKGTHALAEIRMNPYSLVFLEIGIADGAGKVVLKEIGRSSPSTCIVVMSAGATNGDTESIIIEGNHFFLPKPFEILQVRTMTNRILSEIPGIKKDLNMGELVGRKMRSSVRHPLPGDVVLFPDPESPYPGTLPQVAARIMDFSLGGMGVQTDIPLPPGQSLSLDGDGGTNRGVVRWSMVFENRFRSGIQFV